ncbi:MAG: carbohydrate ABC transporter permease, partial [Propionibacteriaceae bacterium]
MSATVDTRTAPTVAPAASTRSGSSKWTRRKVLGYLVTLVTWVIVFLFFFPILWMILTSFKSEGAAASFPPQIISDPTLDRYVEVFRRGMGLYLANSAAVAILSTIAVMALAIPAAYALSVRPIGKWQDALFFFISTKFMPVAASIIPVFLLLRTLNLLDNLWALGVLYIGINLPLAV